MAKRRKYKRPKKVEVEKQSREIDFTAVSEHKTRSLDLTSQVSALC